MTPSIGDGELHLETREERRPQVKNQSIRAWLEMPLRQVGDPSVLIRLLSRQQLVLPVELDAHTSRRRATRGVKHMRGDRGLHTDTISARDSSEPP